MRRICILGGQVIDPAAGVKGPGDLVISGTRIAAACPAGSEESRPQADDEVLEASGYLVLPGLVDMHVHLREPGMQQAEDIASGSRAAAAGGFTTLVCQPNTKPVVDNPETLLGLMEAIRKKAVVRVLQAAALSLGLRGRRASEHLRLIGHGACALSDDGIGTRDAGILRQALAAGAEAGVPTLVHCEDREKSSGGSMTAGSGARRLGLRGIPAAAERVATERVLGAVEKNGGRLHVQHVSTRGALNAVRRAKDAGLPVTCEVTPHHLFLTQKDVVESARAGAPDPNLKMNPPLRSRKDLDALRQGLSDGSVDAIASDHAPHTRDSKARGFARAPFGVTGLETTLSLVLRLVEEGVVGLERGVELVSASPAEILGLEAGSLRPGSPADVTIVDPDKGWRVEPDEMLSRSANTAFAGWHLPGRVKWCLYRGEIVYGRDAAG